jgi:hypothetical protein
MADCVNFPKSSKKRTTAVGEVVCDGEDTTKAGISERIGKSN